MEVVTGPLLFAASVTAFVTALYVAQHLVSVYLARSSEQELDAHFLTKRAELRDGTGYDLTSSSHRNG